MINARGYIYCRNVFIFIDRLKDLAKGLIGDYIKDLLT